MNNFDEAIKGLSPKKRALLDLLLKEKKQQTASQGISPRTDVDKARLSFAQQRLWFLEQWQPKTSAYNLCVAYRLNGSLVVPALEQALTEIVRRHESLRTVFSDVKGEPVQIIEAGKPVTLNVIDVEGETDKRREIAVQLASEEAQATFDLERGPLFKTLLYRVSSDENLLLLRLHHIIADGWSLGVLVQELSVLYNAFIKGEPSSLPEITTQYSDYAEWQRDGLNSESFDEQLKFWKSQLVDSKNLELPTDRTRGAIQSYRGKHLFTTIEKSLVVQLRKLSEQTGVTLFMTLMAAFQSVLARYSGLSDITVGLVTAGRNRTEVENLIGFFTNTLAIRSEVKRELTFVELLENVKKTTLDAYAHQDFPFDRLVEELRPERDLSRTPIFQVSITMHNAVSETLELNGLAATQLLIEAEASKFDLSLEITEKNGELHCVFEYCTDLFDETTIQRLARHFESLLTGICSDPNQLIAKLPLLTPTEQDQILNGWNNTAVPYDLSECLHERFEAQVDRTPDSIAVVFGESHLTYKQLDERSNQLGNFLRRLGVGPEVLVGVVAERSLEMVIALYGILKAGGAYVPIDPEYPAERIQFMLSDARVSVLLTQEHLTNQLDGVEAKVICLDSQWNDISNEAKDRIESSVDPNNLAYVIYTSGSTGKPKGAMNTHRAVNNRLQWMQDAFSLTESDRVLQKTPFSFDVSVWEFFWPLQVGARLVIAEPGGHRDSHYLVNLIEQERITALHFVPSMLQQFLLEDDVERCSSLHRVICSGEALPYEAQERFFSRLETAELHNLYGPTEAAIDVTWWACDRKSDRRSVPIGRPISNIQIYILDEDLQPVPIGVTGQLYIGGVGLARGYWNSPELTAEKFIKNPFSDDSSARLYKTGDLARYLLNGEIEYLGRIDYQVKLRGLRVELGEIEAALHEQSEISEAVVVVRPDKRGDSSLVAYVVASGEFDINGSEIRQRLKQKLPEYMVPTRYVNLDHLPLNANGKIDRSALAAIDHVEVDQLHEFVEPRTPVEGILTGIWQEVLRHERVGVTDNFFERGGHSLLATQVMSRVRSAFHVNLALRVIFEEPTIERFAKKVEEARRQEESTMVEPLLPAPRDKALPLSFAQQRLWFLNQLDANSAVYNLAVALRLHGALDLKALQRTLSHIIERHESLRTTFSANEGDPVQIISAHGPVLPQIFELDDQLTPAERDEKIRQLVQDDVRQPFNLSLGPLIRATLFSANEHEHELVITMHHVVGDAWSVEVLLHELNVLYNDFAAGRESSLQPLPVQYADFAHWQRSWMQGDVLEKQMSFWRQRFSGNLPVIELPLDRPRPPVQTFHGALETFAISTDLQRQLRRLSREEGTTLFMTMFATFLVLLNRYSLQKDVIVGTPVAGRNRIETESLIGFFVNTLPMRFDLSGKPTFREILRQVREVVLETDSHQDVPFEKLVEELQPERDLSRTPLYQVVFMLQNAALPEMDLAGVKAVPRLAETGAAKFDLVMALQDEPDSLSGVLEYNSDLFVPSTINRMLEHYQSVLERVVESPDQKLSELTVLSADERQQLVVDWNDTAIDFPLNQTVHSVFEAQVHQSPENVAVVSSGKSLTYLELNSRANQLARYLRQQGVGPDTLVGILMDRSVEMITALVAVLKAGGAYVPIDPQYPQERLSFVIQDAALKVVLTQQSLLEKVPARSAPTLCVDSDWSQVAGFDPANFVNETRPQNLAYVIYTSGSTGQPKGVEVEHRSLMNLCCWHQTTYSVVPSDRATQVASLAFDASVWEIWPYLTAGASLYLIDEDTRNDANRLLGWLVDNEITLTFLPTPLAEVVLSQPIPANLKLRALLTGGDRLHRVSRTLPFRLINHYGPTENTVVATACDVEPSSGDQSAPPIGRPISNTQAYVLDENLQLVPIGVSGELFIGGDSLARGYHKRPELTAERFIPDPFGRVEGGRLYRTGDLVRYLANGQLDFLGRTDEQVKIRGHRIETGEIEATLSAYAGIREAAVMAREDVPGEKRLVGYVVPDVHVKDETTWTSDVRRYLTERLPQYMVPQSIVVIEALPLSPHGKVDRQKLPAPVSTARDNHNDTRVAPRTQAEILLAGIWQEVLKLDKVGVHDNFFDLGGDSILSIQITARATQAGFRVSAKQLFQNQTIAELAVAGKDGAEFESEQGEIIGEVPLTPIQRWFFDLNLADAHQFNQAVKLQLQKPVDPILLERSVERLLAHHDALRMRFELTGNEWRQINSSMSYLNERATSAFKKFDFSNLSLHEQAGAIEETVSELHASFNLSEPPLLRVALFQLGDCQPDQLFFVIHHLVIDGVSWRIILEDFERIYELVAGSATSSLPAKTTSFKRWSERLVEFSESSKIREEANYWIELSERSTAEIPVDNFDGLNTEGSSTNIWAKLTPEETRDLLQAVPKAYRTQINDALLTALVQAFSSWTGDNALLLNLEGHGREEFSKESDISRTVGWFTTMFPVHLRLNETVSIRDALKSIKEQLRRSLHQGLGYGLLRYLIPDQEIAVKLQAGNRPQISFNYLGQFDQMVSSSSLFSSAMNDVADMKGSFGPGNLRPHLIDVVTMVMNNQLHITFRYSENIHRPETIDRLLQNYLTNLRSIINQCQEPEVGSVTASDFIAAKLSQKDLNKLMSRINRTASGNSN